MGQREQWPSAGRVVHIGDGLDGCRGASIVRVIGDPGPDADVELFIYPSNSLNDSEFDDRVEVHRDEWHWPEYVGPAAE